MPALRGLPGGNGLSTAASDVMDGRKALPAMEDHQLPRLSLRAWQVHPLKLITPYLCHS